MAEKKETVGGVELSAKEIESAKKEGALDYIKEGGRNAVAADTGTTNYDAMAEEQANQVPADLQSTFLAPMLDLSLDELERRLTDAKATDPIAQSHAPGLLALERSAKNRTSYVKMLMGVIGVDSPYDVSSAGPAYTNDDTPVSAL